MYRRWQVIVIVLSAWVLWRETTMIPDLGSNGWAPLGAWDTKAECQEMKAREIEKVKRNWQALAEMAEKWRVEGKPLFEKGKMTFTEDTAILEAKQYSRLEFICLPDTIDPREKKE